MPFTTRFHNAIIKITFFSEDLKDTQRIYKGYTVRGLYYQGGRKNGLQLEISVYSAENKVDTIFTDIVVPEGAEVYTSADAQVSRLSFIYSQVDKDKFAYVQ